MAVVVTARVGTPPRRRTSAGCRLSWPRWHQELGEIEMDALGAASQVVGEDYELDPLQRTYLLSRAETIYGGTQQIHLNIVAERLLGLPRDPRP
jgi:alkylation response protein AidB-like acyl-CoA dehydrogenase